MQQTNPNTSDTSPSTGATTKNQSEPTKASCHFARASTSRRSVLKGMAGGVVLGFTGIGSTSATGASFGDGVNLQPSYFCSGDQQLGWGLMNQYPAIQTVRIEIEPFSFDEVVTTRDDAKRWIDEATTNGYDVIASYHHYPDNGAPDAGPLQSAAEWWVDHYDYLTQDSSITINLMNEWGDHTVTADQYASAYNEALSTIRSGVGYDGPIVCDAPGWGQETHRLAEATTMIDDSNLICSVHVYPSGWNQHVNEALSPSHLDVLDATGYPCLIGEFGNWAASSSGTDWEAVVDHAKSLGWPVIGWAWNGDGSDEPMNMADPYWGDSCSASSYTTSDYFDVVYAKLGDSPADTTPPTEPSGLTTTTGETTVAIDWTPATDAETGVVQYVVTVDGSNEHTVPAGTTSSTITGLTPETTYQLGVVAVDGAGNQSSPATTTATTVADDTDPPASALVIDNFDDDPGWSTNRNDLGQWCGAGSFVNDAGTESGGVLTLVYDNGGWFQTQINRDISNYATLIMRLRGANGGEADDILFDMGGVQTLLSNVTDDSITTDFTDVAIDLEAAGVDRTDSSLPLRLNFWQGGMSTLEITEIRLE